MKSTVYPALDARGTLMVIGTILRWRSALHLMLTSPDEPYCNFQRRIYRAYQEDGTSLWEARHPVARLKLQKQLMGSVAFNREKMNEPAPDGGFFKEEWIHYYHPDSLKDRELVVTGFFDPSMETGATSDYKAFITVGWCRREMVFYVMDAVIQKATLEQVMRTIYNRHQQFGYQVVGVEDNLFQRLLLKEFDRLGRGAQPDIAPERGDPPHRQGDPGRRAVAALGAGQDSLHPRAFGPGAAGGTVALFPFPDAARRWAGRAGRRGNPGSGSADGRGAEIYPRKERTFRAGGLFKGVRRRAGTPVLPRDGGRGRPPYRGRTTWG